MNYLCISHIRWRDVLSTLLPLGFYKQDVILKSEYKENKSTRTKCATKLKST